MKFSTACFLLFFNVVCCSVMLSGCNRAENFGDPFSSDQTVSVEDILKNPEKFKGKDVKVSGTIENECPTGCWFNMKDKENILYVTLSPSGFAIPQKVGKDVIVEGEVQVNKNNVSLIGKGVRIQ